jgi:integrase
MVNQGYAGKTIDTRLNIVFSLLKKNGIAARIPRDEMPTIEEEVAVPYTEEELKRLFAEMDEEETIRYKFFLGTGCRDKEVTFAAWSDIDFDKKTYHIRRKEDRRNNKGQRHWNGKGEQQQAVYANRRRVNGAYGKRLLRKRGEMIERSFAHCYDTGGMRRTHLRGHQNILKRLLIHVGAFNLSLIFRSLLGSGTPREWNYRQSSPLFLLLQLFHRYSALRSRTNLFLLRPQPGRPQNKRYLRYKLRHSGKRGSATGC